MSDQPQASVLRKIVALVGPIYTPNDTNVSLFCDKDIVGFCPDIVALARRELWNHGLDIRHATDGRWHVWNPGMGDSPVVVTFAAEAEAILAALEATTTKVKPKERYTVSPLGDLLDNGTHIHNMKEVAALLNSPGQYTQPYLDEMVAAAWDEASRTSPIQCVEHAAALRAGGAK